MTDIESPLSLVRDEDQSNEALCTVLCFSVEVRDGALNGKSKQGIENDIPNVVETVAESIYKQKKPLSQ